MMKIRQIHGSLTDHLTEKFGGHHRQFTENLGDYGTTMDEWLRKLKLTYI